MNAFLSALQVLLALHTAIGAMWKLANSEKTVPSLEAFPHGVWLGLGVLEMICALALIVGLFNNRTAQLTPIAAGVIAVEMLLFSGVHLASGSTAVGQLIYWLVVAAICAFVAYGRRVFKPIPRSELA